jgi:acyl dehydratase
VTSPLYHVIHQGPLLGALGRVALSSLRKRPAGPAPATPGPWLEATLPPRPASLVADYLRHVGADPSWYRRRLPPHLFPQWSFPLAARVIAGLPYPLERVMNAGCRIEVRSPLPADEPLQVRVRLESIDDDGKRAILTQRIITGTASAPEALIADQRAYVPLARGPRSGERARPTVPTSAREIAFFRLPAEAGLHFAALTGDFNPIHWLRPYARAFGFRACILHGYATLARALAAVERRRFAGDPTRLDWVDARFTRPLVLPAKVGVYITDEGGLYVGDAPGGGAYLEGRFAAHPHAEDSHHG